MGVCCQIKVGEIYRNYKELCKQLDEPVNGGGEKINQLEHWQTCFLWEREGQKYKITQIMKPLDKRPHIQRENSKWYKSVVIILLNKVIDTIKNECDSEGSNEVILTSIEAYELLGLCNGKFKNLKSDQNSEIPIEHRIKFYKEATNIFYYILNNVLKSLVSQKILIFSKTYRLARAAEGYVIRLATIHELKLIKEITDNLLSKFNLKNEHDVMLLGMEAIFYSERKKLLEQVGIFFCFKVYRISITEYYLPKFNEFLDSLETKTSAKIDLNGKSYKELKRKIFQISSDENNFDDDDLIFRNNLKKILDSVIPLID